MRPKAATFDIATRGGGREQRRGYVLGSWAAHKEPGRGVYFWTFTHLPTGTSVNVYPPHETKASALGHLAVLHERGPTDAQKHILESAGKKWGLGL